MELSTAAKPANVGPRKQSVHPSRFRPTEVARNSWFVVPEVGTPLTAVLEPGYWAHIAARLRPNDRIEVDAEDGSWTALLIVQSVSRLAATVAVLFSRELAAPEPAALPEDLRVMWKGPMHKHAVVRLSDDKKILQSGFDSKVTALAWMAMNARTLV
jgi:hypothetical protein